MTTIWKFILDHEARVQPLMLPKGAEILSVKLVAGDTVLHVLLDPNEPLVTRHIHCVGTGWEVPKANLHYIDTVVHRDGVFIYHYFEERQT